MASNPNPPFSELTEQDKQRIEANRLRALAKRKAIISQQQQQQQNPLPSLNPHNYLLNNDQNDYWRLFKSRKLNNPLTNSPTQQFRVRLEICEPDSFSVVPLPSTKGFPFPGQDHCFRVLQNCLSNVMLTHYTQIHDVGEAFVYKLKDYDAVLRCLKSFKEIEVEEIPWNTYNVVKKLSNAYISRKWTPCRPEHLSDEKVDELIGKVPRKLLNTLLPFQLEGLKFGLQRGGRCLIADEMGLGKTLQAISIASCFADEDSILVVCPAILRYSWAEELERWLPSYLPADIHLVFGSKDNPLRLTTCPKIVVISYTMLNRLKKDMLQLNWSVIIIDESHHIRCSKKTSEPKEIQAVLDVSSKANHIILLSGTPSLSRPFDIYHQINMLWPGLLGKDKFEFAKTYCCPKPVKDPQGNTYMDYSRGTRLEELNILLRQTVMIRRLKEHLLVQLPPKRRQIIRLSLEKSDIVLAKKDVAALNKSHPTNNVDEDNEDGHNRELCDHALGISKVFGFLEWLSLHPIITEADESTNNDSNVSSHKMIIFAHHILVLNKIQAFICNKGIGFVRIDGNVNECDRQSSLKSFQSSKEVKIAIIGITVGSAGLDLSVAHNVVILELPKDQTSLLQAEDRAHRRGQTNAVNIYIFCAKGTSDESRWQNLNKSAECVSSTIDGKCDAVRGLKVDNLSCTGITNVYCDALPLLEEYTTENKEQQTEVGYDAGIMGDEKVDATQLINNNPDHLTLAQGFVQPNFDSLRFAVSKYTERVHLCTCDNGEDSAPRSLSENFQLEEISADSSEWTSLFVKENPACQHAILSFTKEWKNLKRTEQKKLLGKPLQLPLVIELSRLCESKNHDSNGLLKGGSRRRHTPLCEISDSSQCNTVPKSVRLHGDNNEKLYKQNWSLLDEPLCKLCQEPCTGTNAKKPKEYFDLFCTMDCYKVYCSKTSGSFLRREVFEIERGICTLCQLDCHKLVQYLKPLTKEDREKFIKRDAPQLAKRSKWLEKLVREPTEGNAWHADHIVPVFLGGGECNIENMRTLCVACHAVVTASQRAQWCKSKKLPKDHNSAVKENIDDDSVLLGVDVPNSAYSKPKEVDDQ